MGTNSLGGGPLYSALGLINRLSESCSRIWADQPAVLLKTNIGVYKGIGIPSK